MRTAFFRRTIKGDWLVDIDGLDVPSHMYMLFPYSQYSEALKYFILYLGLL